MTDGHCQEKERWGEGRIPGLGGMSIEALERAGMAKWQEGQTLMFWSN